MDSCWSSWTHAGAHLQLPSISVSELNNFPFTRSAEEYIQLFILTWTLPVQMTGYLYKYSSDFITGSKKKT